MKNELTVFNSPEFGQLRMIFIEGKQYFVANDVAKARSEERRVGKECRR